MEHPLTVGTDGSDAAFRSLDWAVDEAARHTLPLRIVHASRWERYEGTSSAPVPERPVEQVLAEDIVASAADHVRRRHADVRVSAEVLADDAVTVLLNEGLHASALVLGSRGHGEIAGLLLGSVSLTVAARARCPVIVVRGDPAGLAGTHERVLLGVADPAGEMAAVRFAFREAEARGCTLEAVCAWRRPAPGTAEESPGEAHRSDEEQATALLDDALAEAAGAHPAVRVERAVVEGPAHKVLVHRAAAADLLVVGAQCRQGHFGLQPGRVAHTALCHAACPVAVVPRTA
ncbi:MULTISPECIES: universal stress protein [unclassified Streptomyces]|uniref:universal stress protein n=1 Tax=unclassified Streptomyces TaxID=2593676 RepID=UPI00089953BF|nr:MULTISPECIES: universal stress protein [unclassified Streptomyces]PBC80721.1 nucleotide-binding universal stress UspA family protein [Streptomyces sp. 2321.6]SEB85945.1 Nucleotide-binding universal stress protein, UspA family [Streptomyces sp. 2133.1]SNC61826.1 Nucleotide-binding universal stress protein, UspA family [Streptomyces sp. 2114.4]